jgi:hypothetical protein
MGVIENGGSHNGHLRYNKKGFEEFGVVNERLMQEAPPLNMSGGESALSMNPVHLNSQSGVVKLTTNVGFTNLSCESHCAQNMAEWNFSDVMRAVQETDLRNQLSNYSPSFAVPVSLKVLGTSLGELENYFALQVYDNSPQPRALHSVTGFKLNSDGQMYKSGYPLYLLKHGMNNVLLKSGTFNSEHLGYWSLNMDMLNQDVVNLHLPGKNTDSVLVRRDSQAANMLNYALSVKNQVITPPLLENEAFIYQMDREFLSVPAELYTDVKHAYEAKFDQVRSDSYDLSNIKFSLAPLPGVSADKLEAVDQAFVSLEIVAHMGIDTKASSEGDVGPGVVSNGLFESRPAGDIMDDL